MKNATVLQSGLPRRDRTPTITKIALAVVFVLGLVIIAMGYLGMQEYGASGGSRQSASPVFRRTEFRVESSDETADPERADCMI